MALCRVTYPAKSNSVRRPRPNPAAKALAHGVCRQRILPSGKLYRRAPKHRGRVFAEWSV